jgi:hypothetical protein
MADSMLCMLMGLSAIRKGPRFAELYRPWPPRSEIQVLTRDLKAYIMCLVARCAIPFDGKS